MFKLPNIFVFRNAIIPVQHVPLKILLNVHLVLQDSRLTPLVCKAAPQTVMQQQQTVLFARSALVSSVKIAPKLVFNAQLHQTALVAIPKRHHSALPATMEIT
jgi:uncharacterized protein YcfL